MKILRMYAREEVLKAIDEAYWAGHSAAQDDMGSEYYSPADYLPKN